MRFTSALYAVTTPSCCLQVVVHGLPFAYAWQDLKDLFRPVGGVATTEIVTDRNTGRSKGWGTVIFESESDAQKAIEVWRCLLLAMGACHTCSGA